MAASEDCSPGTIVQVTGGTRRGRVGKVIRVTPVFYWVEFEEAEADGKRLKRVWKVNVQRVPKSPPYSQRNQNTPEMTLEVRGLLEEHVQQLQEAVAEDRSRAEALLTRAEKREQEVANLAEMLKRL